MLASADLRLNSDRSELKAYASGPALRNLVNSLSSQGEKIHLFGHSMGNIVVSEAMRIEAMSAAAQAPNYQKPVKTFIASQAASVSSAYDPNSPKDLFATYGSVFNGWGISENSGYPDLYTNFTPTGKAYFEEISRSIEKSYNFYNEVDGAVGQAGVWPANQAWKPDNQFFFTVPDPAGGDPFPAYSEYGYVPAGFFERIWIRTTLGGWATSTRRFLNPSAAQDAHAIFAYALEAKSKGLGATPDVRFVFSANGQVNLQGGYFSENNRFAETRYDHSGQFNQDNRRRNQYWNAFMKRIGQTPAFDTTPNLPAGRP